MTLLQFDLRDRSDLREGSHSFFVWFSPYQYHTRVPRNFIYIYSFSLKPEEFQPSGTCNFSRIDSATLDLVLNECVIQKDTQLNIYATNYNVLRIEAGIAGIVYAD